jgi:S-adenosylmethionine hydrolase
MNLQPVIEKNLIKGAVIYIDSFQNVITNITKEFFNQVQQGSSLRYTLNATKQLTT